MGHFKESEFACHHCGTGTVKDIVVQGLEQLRELVQAPIIIDSGYRCANHPIERAKICPGYHNKHLAVDIRVHNLTARELYAYSLKVPSIHGRGVDDENNYLHIDFRPQTVEAKWCYQAGCVIPFYEVRDV